jgi:hypothetical protein
MAGLTTTQTFSDGDTVTAAKLNNIVSNASIDADAVTTAKILNANVTLAKMATLSVDTGQLVDDSVQNAKLNDMAAKTVKANATNGAANPTDLPIVTSELLAGTSDSINAVSFTTDLEMVDSSDVIATDNTASKIRVANNLIDGKATATVVPANDTVLVYDADGAGTSKLRKTTVTSMMQTLPAVTTTSGVVRLATTERSINPNTASTVDADVLTTNNASPMLAKAWAEFPGRTTIGACTITFSENIESITRTANTGEYNVVFRETSPSISGVAFPSDSYTVQATGYVTSSWFVFGRITGFGASTGDSCTIQFSKYSDVATGSDPTGRATIVFFGSTS